MKTALLGLMIVLMSASAFAGAEHHFVYKMKDNKNQLEVFEFSSTAPSWEKAFEDGAQACYRHFKGGKRLNEERGLDIIDACANPRSKI